MKATIRIILLLGALLCASPAFADRVAVIANNSVPHDALDRARLFDIYAGDVQQWSDGQPVITLDLKPKSEVKSVFYSYLGKSWSRMKSIWMKKMLAGEAKPPESLTSEEELLRFVASTPGAIGYISPSLVSGANGQVQTLLVIGEE